MSVRIESEVAETIERGGAVVALESTIFSALGLPAPTNREVLDDCLAAIRAGGATPAVCAVIDGVAVVGTNDFDRVLATTRKLGERDLPVAIASGATGVTTVSATVAMAAAAGIEVFATGGIGGVHRGVERTGDISADLGAIARHPVVTVTAGVKGFLDVARTVEHLEMLGVPVIGWQTNEFPAFWSRTSGIHLDQRVDDVATMARIVRAARSLRSDTGLIVAAPCPAAEAIDAQDLAPIIDGALQDAERAGVASGAVTPFVLERIFVSTNGRSIVANRSLAVQNAQIAATLSLALTTTSL